MMNNIVKKRTFLFIIAIVFSISILGGISYAIFRRAFAQTGENVVTATNCLQVDFSGENILNLNGEYPKYDEDGVNEVPYTFTVHNTCNNNVELKLGVERLTSSTIDGSNLKVAMNRVNGSIQPSILTTNTTGTPLNGGTAYILLTDMLQGGQSKDYEFRMWIKNDATDSSVAGKALTAKVIATATIKTNYYAINCIEDLVRLSNDVNGGTYYAGVTFDLLRDLDFNNNDSYNDPTDTSFGDINGDGVVENIKTELTKLSGSGFPAIGNVSNRKFQGNFEGNNYSLSNIYQNISGTMSGGLFGFISNSKIANLTISGNITKASGTNGSVAGLAANAYNQSTISNCHSSVAITSNGSVTAAGLVANNQTNASLTIVNSSNDGTISNGNYTGGLVGYNHATLNINNSVNRGSVTSASGTYVGGLLAMDSLTDSGIAVTNINNSYNYGTVNCTYTQNGAYRIGGLIGKITQTANINNSYNLGNVSDNSTHFIETHNYHSVGGLIGIVNGAANVEINNSYNAGDIYGGNRIGGLIGTNYYNGSIIKINKSYNTGKVYTTRSGKDTSNAAQQIPANVGGVIGLNHSTLYILNSYNTGNIEINVTIADYDVLTIAGGLIGVNNKNASSSINSNSAVYIYNSYDTGDIKSSHGYASGIIGRNNENGDITINNVYSRGKTCGINSCSNYAYMHGIGFINTSSNYTINNAYANTTYAHSVTNISGVGTDSTSMSTSSIVSALNSNINSISLPSAVNGYNLLGWKEGTTTPELNF